MICPFCQSPVLIDSDDDLVLLERDAEVTSIEVDLPQVDNIEHPNYEFIMELVKCQCVECKRSFYI